MKKNICNKMNNNNILEQSEESYNFLMITILEEENNISMIDAKIKECQQVLLEEKALLKDVVQNTNNLELFSPNYIKTNNDFETKTKLDNYSNELDRLLADKEKLLVKRDSLYKTKQCLNCLLAELQNYNEYIDNNDCRKKYSEDIGLDILKVQETERQRIARDLHDSIVQNLTNLVHRTELCSKLLDVDTIRTKLELIAMTKTIRGNIEDMRSIIYDLRPMSLDDLGLLLTVERYAKQLMEMNEIKVVLHANEEISNILSVINLTLFRIIQEACNNVLKHAHATRIDINIDYLEDMITVSIKDDGIGFNREKECDHNTDSLTGLGLSIMKERIYLLSGKIDMQSEFNKGTIITVCVPFTISRGKINESN